jgi:hypothetical protein
LLVGRKITSLIASVSYKMDVEELWRFDEPVMEIEKDL